MPFSMTGYGRHFTEDALYRITVEIRSVNHRFLDIYVRLPQKYLWLEFECAQVLKGLFRRGKIEVHIQLEPKPEASTTKVVMDENLLRQYLDQLGLVKQRFRLPGRLRVEHLLLIPEHFFVVEAGTNDQTILGKTVILSVKEAARRLLEMREREGVTIAGDLRRRIQFLQEQIDGIEKIAPELPGVYREKIHNTIKEFAGEAVIDENRLAAEILYYTERASITEEIVRFKSHLEQFLAALSLKVPVGRKLDFITQELLREINTIGSKTSDLLISRQVVEIKTEIERIKEQVQNIE